MGAAPTRGTLVGRLGRACRRALRLVARPVRTSAQRGGIVLQPYRGYGSAREVFLIGRVFRQPLATVASDREPDTLLRALADVGRRFLRRGVRNASLVVRFTGKVQPLTTDRDGYFRAHLRLDEPPPADLVWHEIELELSAPVSVSTRVELFIPPPACRFVVISDIDDTIMHTGVANKLRMLWRLFMEDAESRTAFPGVAALLRALHLGATGSERNPMLYISRAPWSIYEVLDAFFQQHAIPVGPLLFLREWGLTLQSPMPRRAKGHKLALIRHMLEVYQELPFILIGDSGQRDPEIYAQVVREHPGRVRAVYIRNVSRKPERVQAIERLAAEVADAGSSLLLAADSLAMAEHAAAQGLVPPAALAEVAGERKAEGEDEPRAPTQDLTPEAAEAGGLAAALEPPSPGTAAPSLVIEPDPRSRGSRATS